MLDQVGEWCGVKWDFPLPLRLPLHSHDLQLAGVAQSIAFFH
jgi:hypothetical protein